MHNVIILNLQAMWKYVRALASVIGYSLFYKFQHYGIKLRCLEFTCTSQEASIAFSP